MHSDLALEVRSLSKYDAPYHARIGTQRKMDPYTAKVFYYWWDDEIRQWNVGSPPKEVHIPKGWKELNFYAEGRRWRATKAY